jgi:hypothetical protein
MDDGSGGGGQLNCCDAKETRVAIAEHIVDSPPMGPSTTAQRGIPHLPPCHSLHLLQRPRHLSSLDRSTRTSWELDEALCDLNAHAHAHKIAGWCGMIRPRHHLCAVPCTSGEANIYDR